MEEYIPSYPNIAFDKFNQIISNKKEFLDDVDPIFFKHQKNIARFLSPKTLYNSILLIHEMGTGKTATAIATIELIRQQDPNYKHVVVLASGKTQLNVFRDEIFRRVPYLLEKYASTKLERPTILKREGYTFDTYRVFAKEIRGLSDKLLQERFEHTIFIMDEIHNLTSSKTNVTDSEPGITNTKAYRILNHLMKLLKNRKLLCMTGTPIRDQPYEIAKLLNLVVPLDKQFETGQAFQSKYFDIKEKVTLLGDVEYPVYEWKPNSLKQFQDIMIGYTSYLKRQLPKQLSIEFMTNPKVTLPLKQFKVFGHIMSEEQSTLYLQNFIQDLETSDKDNLVTSSLAYFRSRQASLFVFPEEEGDSIGKKAADIYIKYVPKPTDKSKLSSIAWKPKMKILFPTQLSISDRLLKVKQYSVVYSFLIDEILRNPSELVYIYAFLKSGCGIYVFVSFLIQYFNFELVTTIEQMKTKSTKKRVVVLNADFFSDSQLKIIIDEFNRDENKFGEYVQVVIGTKQTKEGITLKNIRQIHIVQPEWNYADISQALARGIRVGSHLALEEYYQGKQIYVRIFQHCAIPLSVEETDEDEISYGDSDLDNSVDLEQYKRSEIKDMNIKLIERALLESSWDCFINKERNQGHEEGSRECEYTTCSFKCVGETEEVGDDYSTFNPYYSDSEKAFIAQNILNVYSEIDAASEEWLMTNPFHNYPNPILVWEVLNTQFILNNRQITNRKGLPAYLKKWNQIYYLTDNPFTASYSNFYYYEQNVLETSYSFQGIVSNLMKYRFTYFLVSMIRFLYKNTVENKNYCIQQIVQTPLPLQELLLESILRLKISEKMSNIFFDIMIDHYQTQKRLMRYTRFWKSTLLPTASRYYIISLDKWTNDNPETDDNITGVEEEKSTTSLETTELKENSDAFNDKYINNNEYGFYGILEIGKADTKFKIRDVRNKELVYGTNKSKVPKGELCGQSFSKKKDGLIGILFLLGYEAPSDKLTLSVSEIKTMFIPNKKGESTSLIKLYDKLNATKEIQFESFTEENWKTLYILSKLKLPELCQLVREKLTQLDLIFTKKV